MSHSSCTQVSAAEHVNGRLPLKLFTAVPKDLTHPSFVFKTPGPPVEAVVIIKNADATAF